MAAYGTSQYRESYLDANARRGDGRGITIGSFLTYELSGTARDYSGRYAAALEHAMDVAAASGDAYAARSRCGGVAWYRTPPAAGRYFKLLARLKDGRRERYVSIYDGTRYPLRRWLTVNPILGRHQGGYYVAPSRTEALRATFPKRSRYTVEPRVLVEVQTRGQGAHYGEKFAFPEIRLLRVIRED